ncbi:hypothetical protein M0R45_005068 [Rubus argutus]|uniref:DUF4220 domain-containing protein n=1 Tax=Rubus argutus TaxID=59490 RepID=A0AAW1YLK3_RUBAR
MASVGPISKRVKNIWDEWNLRSFIILSLSLQTFLILFAPLRKRTSSKWLMVPIWLAYLLADWAANFAIGLIASRQTDTESSPDNGGLLAFWAPFLLLHLGGPDTIIAVAMEDNALWPRHFLGLIFQAVAAVYVFIMQSSPQNKLRWPTLLLFFPGLVKYGERTRALYLASLESLKETMPEPGPDYAKYLDVYSTRKAANLPITIHTQEAGPGSESKNVTYRLEEVNINNISLVQGAHHLFQTSMGLIIDLVFNFHQRSESRAYFLERTPEDAYTLIATELNFMYEALYTKAYVVHSRWGYILRATSFGVICIALVFFNKLEKHGFHWLDVGVTYSLLFGAIALDAIALSMLLLSDWTVAAVYKFGENKSKIATVLLKKYLDFKRSLRSTTRQSPTCLERTRYLLFRRWSESVSGFSFINYSLQECGRVSVDRPASTTKDLSRYCLCLYRTIISFLSHLSLKIIERLCLKYLRDELKYKSSETVTKELWNFIFEELKSKSSVADVPETGSKLCSSRGEWVLGERYKNHPELLSSVAGVTYDGSVLLWHIATELCYYEEEMSNENRKKEDMSNERRQYSKMMSDYMLYLLIMQPALMSSVAGIGQKRFRDTVAEAKQFFKKRGLGKGGKPDRRNLGEACKKLLKVDTLVKPVDVKGNISKSVLFDACILAKELKKLEGLKWKLISEVWVELLSYAASHCRAQSHAQLLSKGGELVTFVWLLMARFGIAEQFQVREVQTTTGKLIMEKHPDVFNISYIV